MAVLRRPADLVEAPEGPARELVQPGLEPRHLQAPRLDGVAREAELGERDAEFGRPAQGVDAGRHVPDGVPGRVEIGAVGSVPVGLHAGRVRGEGHAAEVVVEGVEDDLDVVEPLGIRVPAHQARAHAGGALGVEHAGADVERVAVEEEADLGALRGGLALARLGLREVPQRLDRLPGDVVEAAVEHDRARAPHRAHGPGRRDADGPAGVLGQRAGWCGQRGGERRSGEDQGGDAHGRPDRSGWRWHPYGAGRVRVPPERFDAQSGQRVGTTPRGRAGRTRRHRDASACAAAPGVGRWASADGLASWLMADWLPPSPPGSCPRAGR